MKKLFSIIYFLAAFTTLFSEVYFEIPSDFKSQYEILGCFITFEGKVLVITDKSSLFQLPKKNLPDKQTIDHAKSILIDQLCLQIEEKYLNPLGRVFVINGSEQFTYHIMKVELTAKEMEAIKTKNEFKVSWISSTDLNKLPLLNYDRACLEDLFKEKKDKNYPINFAVCAIFQNEAKFLKEWIEYHRLLGAEKFYLYNNESQDNFLDILKPYINSGIVDLKDWHDPDFQNHGQREAYADAINRVKSNVKWLAIIDVDEFIVPKIAKNIPDFLKDYERNEIGGVGINWQMFGTSHIKEIRPNELITEKFILKACQNYGGNYLVKSIVRPDLVIMTRIHHFHYRLGFRQVDVNYQPFLFGITKEVITNKIQINHY